MVGISKVVGASWQSGIFGIGIKHSHVTVNWHVSRGGVSSIRAADRFFWRLIDIVALSSIYRRFPGPSDRRYIVDISSIYRRGDISTVCEPHVTFYLRMVFMIKGLQEAHALRVTVAIHNAVYTNKLNEPNLMQHGVSLRDHSSWPRQGPWGARRRLPVTN